MKCPQCGNQVVGEAIFCHRCGERLEKEALSPEVTESAPPSSGSGSAPFGRQSEFSPRGDDDPEEEIWSGSYCHKALIPHALVLALVSILLLVVAIFISNSSGTVWLIVLGLIAFGWLGLGLLLVYRRLDVSYRLTTQRFIHEHGVLRRTTDRIEVIDMDDVTFTQGIIERLIGVGTIQVTSSDRTHPALILRGIDDVRPVADMIDAARRRERVRRGLHIEAV